MSVPAYIVWLLAFRWLASSVFLLVHGHTSSLTRSISHIVSQSFQIVDRVTSWQLSRHKTTEVSAPSKASSSHHFWHIPIRLLFAALAVHTAFPLSSAFVRASYALLTSVRSKRRCMQKFRDTFYAPQLTRCAILLFENYTP